MSNYLAIDTSSRYLCVAARRGEKLAVRYLPECAMKHSVLLMDEIDGALNEINLTPAECDFFAAVTGPGSFTGIRIGISAAKGFAFGADKPLMGVTSFDLIAYNVNADKFTAVIDAAHGFYYACTFNGGEAGAPGYISGAELENSGLPLYGFEELDLKNYNKTALDLVGVVESGRCKLTEDIQALYVRKSQAEENRK